MGLKAAVGELAAPCGGFAGETASSFESVVASRLQAKTVTMRRRTLYCDKWTVPIGD
jgi:hypothetical protein